MGKRSDFDRIDQDRYLTPAAAMPFLAPWLPPEFTFCEPCAANGNLINLLGTMGGTCVAAYDILPEVPSVKYGDARHMLGKHLNGAELIITNPPWARDVLHQMIMRFSRLTRTFLLFDANWVFTDQGAQFMDYRRGRNRVRRIITVGRLIWIPGTTDTGKDDAAWFEIGPPSSEPPEFIGRLT